MINSKQFLTGFVIFDDINLLQLSDQCFILVPFDTRFLIYFESY